MCGIFGLIVKPGSEFKKDFIEKSFEKLAHLSLNRGKDSSGVVFKVNDSKTMHVLKGDVPANELFASTAYHKILDVALKSYSSGNAFQGMGHARLATNGSQLEPDNNQPVIKNGVVAIHNGIIVNADELWANNNDFTRKFEIDTEILLELVRKELTTNPTAAAVGRAMEQVRGTVSAAMFFDDRQEAVLMTNNGSFYYLSTADIFVFASEEYFVKQIADKWKIKAAVLQLKPKECLVLSVVDFSFSLSDYTVRNVQHSKPLVEAHFEITSKNIKSKFQNNTVIDPSRYLNYGNDKKLLTPPQSQVLAIAGMKRCTKCILPETFPFISFDKSGVCNYCNNYRKHTIVQKGLAEKFEPFRNSKLRADCIIPFSGGRDSTYVLHYIKKEMGMKPLAFTYDWGMVTDLARRNIARTCGKLGVENIIVAADIRQKRHYIQQNILAWLKRPSLGMIPLFMSGDKAFHHYLLELQQHTGISLNIWGENYLEKTDFKVGFAGISPEFEKEMIYSLSVFDMVKLLGYIGKETILNPSYINASVLDNLKGQYSRYLRGKKDYYNFYDYYPWDETIVNRTIQEEYDWEKAVDTDSTWRIGDGTSAFYNYIYYTVAGFSEADTFRSNQIREGMIDRSRALRLVEKENEVRYATLRWYLSILQLDFERVIKVINEIPKLYQPK